MLTWTSIRWTMQEPHSDHVLLLAAPVSAFLHYAAQGHLPESGRPIGSVENHGNSPGLRRLGGKMQQIPVCLSGGACLNLALTGKPLLRSLAQSRTTLALPLVEIVPAIHTLCTIMLRHGHKGLKMHGLKRSKLHGHTPRSVTKMTTRGSPGRPGVRNL